MKKYNFAAVILVILASVHAAQFNPTPGDLLASLIFAALAAGAAILGRKESAQD